MHSCLPAKSMANGAVLIAAISGRALAVSARRGGYRPLVADFFGDQDTMAAAQSHIRFCGEFAQGFREHELMEALERLALQHVPVGLVCGTGFEDRPQLLARLAQRWPLLGNSADKVARAKDPEIFAAFCRDCGIAHPRVSLSPPAARKSWVAKRRGGSGGRHVAAASAKEFGDGVYYQSRVPGTPVSALLLANGVCAIVHRIEQRGFHGGWRRFLDPGDQSKARGDTRHLRGPRSLAVFTSHGGVRRRPDRRGAAARRCKGICNLLC